MSTHGPHSFVTPVQAEWPAPFNVRAAGFLLTQKHYREICSGNQGAGGSNSQPPPPNTIKNPCEYRVCVHKGTAKHSKLHEPRNSYMHPGVLNAPKASTFILQGVDGVCS